MSAPASAPRTLVDGMPSAQVAACDRGFTLGDGLFETVAVRAGRVRLWPEHGERLCEGCRRLGLPLPDLAVLAAELERLRGDEDDGTARITWTRGIGARGYAPPPQVRPTRVITWYPGLPPLPSRPLRLRWCATRLGENPALAGLKHLGRLEQVLARAEWDDPETDEGLMQSISGDVVECTSSNLFLVRDDTLVTPALDRCGVAGVVRRHVLGLAERCGIAVRIAPLAASEVAAADELFVTSATRGIAPVGQLAGRPLPAPGPLTRRLQRLLDEWTR